MFSQYFGSGYSFPITLDERVMFNHQVSLLNLTVEAGIPGDVM